MIMVKVLDVSIDLAFCIPAAAVLATHMRPFGLASMRILCFEPAVYSGCRFANYRIAFASLQYYT